MLRALIKKKGVSVYAAAKGSGIPYTTLNEMVNGKKNIADCSIKTIARLADYFGMSVGVLYSKLTDNSAESVKVSQTWQERRYKKYVFPVIAGTDSYDASRIYPLKQRLIQEIYDRLRDDSRIEKLILFGSSTTIRCSRNSDVDIAVKLKDTDDETKAEISDIIQDITNWKADVIWMDRVEENSRLFNNIMRGVQII